MIIRFGLRGLSAFVLLSLCYMESINIRMSFDDFKINLKDVLQIVIYAVLGALAFSAQSAKIDKVITSVELIQIDNLQRKQDEKEKGNKKEIYDQQILNQINTNTIQIKLLEQDVKFLKESKR